jgi:hypothetical protein
MKTVIRIVKRGQTTPANPVESPKANPPRSTEIVRNVKAWVSESRQRRSLKIDYPLWLKQTREEIMSAKAAGRRSLLSGTVSEPVSESAG